MTQSLLIEPSNLWLFGLFVVLFVSLSIGSFLNVVIYRLPVMMKNDWQDEANAFIAEQQGKEYEPPARAAFNLAIPKSTCPRCQTSIKPWHNIPVLGFLWLKGRCANCQAKISWRYPLVEFFTAVIGMLVFWRFGFGWQMPVMLVLSYALVALSAIDFDEQLLPDSISLPLLWLGLLFNSTDAGFVSLSEAIWGAAVGYLSLWSVFWLFKLVTGKEGMGYGDFKLLAVFGAFFGWQVLPSIILLSSLVGAVLGILLIVLFKRDSQKPMPFGPFIALAGWLVAVFPEYFTVLAYF